KSSAVTASRAAFFDARSSQYMRRLLSRVSGKTASTVQPACRMSYTESARGGAFGRDEIERGLTSLALLRVGDAAGDEQVRPPFHIEITVPERERARWLRIPQFPEIFRVAHVGIEERSGERA